ncbi:multicopper oxidase domain-containing protein [Sideroxydans sp. CL21]|uniref:multicopper oxidase domain-containing protein n=1 Tax=Sideroxydans sp. CL21 TaxID=2600596 RepID=UPI0024BC50E0|nr:multicopper oxidase domain-containing protein [Sideroxydans sp. CL21]
MLNFSCFEERLLLALILSVFAGAAGATSFRVQCPSNTITHPSTLNNNDAEPAYISPTTFALGSNGYQVPSANVNGAIKCQQISGGDGYATMADGTQTFMFSFGPLSGLGAIANGQPGTDFPSAFNTMYTGTFQPGDPAASDGIAANTWPTWLGFPLSTAGFTYNGAVGLALDIANTVNIYSISEAGSTVTVTPNAPLGVNVGDQVVIANIIPAGYNGTFTVTSVGGVQGTGFPPSYSFTYTNNSATGLAAATALTVGTASTPPRIDGHVDPRQIMDVGVMNGNIPAPLMAIDEDDEFFLTLSNVGMIMRPDLFEQHTVHFHGYPNASAFYDGVPDASVAINIGGSFTYYYLAPDAGTYFWHCHITPPEHLQMGMVGQIYVRPRQNRVPAGSSLYAALRQQNGIGPTPFSPKDLRTVCNPSVDILCSTNMPVINTGVVQGNDKLGNPQKYAYNDGDGSTAYDVEYPIQIHGFDPNFHFVGMTFNPEAFVDMKDKYFLLNGRSYPDTVTPGPLATQSADGKMHYSQPLPAIINIPAGGKALLRISDLDVSEYQTLASMGIPMKVIGFNAKLLRDQAGNNMYYTTNSITLGGGESLDVILDSTGIPAGTYYLYTSNLDHLSNDAENFGGLMTEVHIN